MLATNIEYKRFVWELSNIIDVNKKLNKKIIFLCIGTSKITGDSLGPLVGTKLKINLKDYNMIEVIGDLENSISYNKIEKNIRNIKKTNTEDLLIVIDAALSNEENIGKIFIQNRGMKYAESLKKQNSIIGDISIKAVVGKDTNTSLGNFFILRNTPINSVIQMSNTLSNGILEVVNKKYNNGKNIYI